MAVSGAIAAYGTLLKIGDAGSPETFTAIAEVTNISGPGITTDTEDVTHHESTGGFKERIPTLLDAGAVTFDVSFIPTAATHRDASGGLLDDQLAKTKRNFQIIWSDSGSTTWSFAAYVTGFSPTAPVGGKLGAAVTLQVTGQPTLA